MTWSELARRLDAFDGNRAGELLQETRQLMQSGWGNELPEAEVNQILERAIHLLVPKADPKRDVNELMDFAEQCRYLIADVVWNEDEPTTDPLMWSAMAAVAYTEVVLGTEPDVVSYVRDYMPQPRPEWLAAVLK